MKLTASFIKNIQATYGQEGTLWLNSLVDHLEKLALQWNFQLIQPVENLSYNFVAMVKLPSGLAVLKTAPSSARLIAEAEWLKVHKKSVPRIFHIDKENNAYIMEKLEPGTSLKQLVEEGKDEEATRIIAQTILDLQSTMKLHQANYQSIREHISSLDFLHGHLDAHIIDRGKSIFKDLCASSTKDIILHGDLHHDNILQNGASWDVIDPHGYVGDPCAEVGSMIFNPLDCFPQHLPLQNTIETRLKILADMLPFDSERIKAWAFCLTLRSVGWDVEGFGCPNYQTLEIAKILNSAVTSHC